MAKSQQSHQTNSPDGPLELFIDPSARRTTTRSLYTQLRDAITSGRLAAGDRLPPSRELATQLGVSRHTITTVYDQLVGEGYADGRAGGGTFVNAMHVDAAPVTRGDSVSHANEVVTTLPTPSPPRFDLRPGAPDPALFPTAEWRRCTVAALQHPLGSYHDPAGSPALRGTLAHWIARSRGLDALPDQIVVTSGAQQAIDLIVRTHVQPGDIVALEEPGYAPVRHLCIALGADVRAVPIDADGLIVDLLPAGARLVYTTPAHQYPSGAVMSLRRRVALLEYAERHDAIIIEDDYDSEYRHVARPLEPLQRLDRSERVAYVDTFSKTLSPALRLGFAVLPRSMVRSVLQLRQLSDWQPSEPQQSAMTRFIADGHLGRHLRRTRTIYTERHRLVTQFLVDAVERGLIERFTPTCAGLHIMAMLPSGTDEQQIGELAAQAGVAVGALAPNSQRADPPPGLIVGFGSIATDQLPHALAALSRSALSVVAVDPQWVRH